MKERKVFLTGITGLLGSNLARTLLKAGFKVKALTRRNQLPDSLNHKNLQLIKGDLDEDWTKELAEVDYFIHAAGVSNPALLKYQDYREVNVVYTQKLLKACKKSHVKKFIYVSSANTIGHGSLEDLGHEELAASKPFTDSFYMQSKREAEEYVLAENGSLQTFVINPTFMIGPFDSKPSSGKIILRALNKRIVFYPKGGKNFVSVKDVTQGIINCLKKGTPAERYLLANENLSYRQFYKKLSKITGENLMLLAVPKPLLIGVGYLGDVLRKLNLKTPLSSVNMRILNVKNYYDNGKSKQVLDVNYQPIEKAIKEAVDYFRDRKTKTN